MLPPYSTMFFCLFVCFFQFRKPGTEKLQVKAVPPNWQYDEDTCSKPSRRIAGLCLILTILLEHP